MRVKRGTGFLALMLVLLVLASGEGDPKVDKVYEISQPYAYDLVRWEAQNFFGKWKHWLEGLLQGETAADDEKVGMVRKYFALGAEMASLESKTSKVNPGGEAVESKPLKEQLAALERERARREATVEDIIEAQLGEILAGEGLSVNLGLSASFLFPPVDFKFDSLPNLLIISPRNKIELKQTILLRSDLNLEQIEEIEKDVEKLGVSALVEGIGGIATYPSTIPRDESLASVVSTVAHEWLHQYFFFQPLGRNYESGSEMRTLNETTASIGGKEIASLVLSRYYGIVEPEAEEQRVKPAFDFHKEMRETRIAVDRYLEAGQVEEAEELMRQKQRLFASKGYLIRRLNQAYFAFHGSYADSSASVSPIGRQLEELRKQSGSLGQFIKTVAQISSYRELEERLGTTKTTLRDEPSGSNRREDPSLSAR